MPSVFIMRHHLRISSEYEETNKNLNIKLNTGKGKGSETTKWKKTKKRQIHGFYFDTIPNSQTLSQIYQSSSINEQEVDEDMFLSNLTKEYLFKLV
jgi:hypothetical protein